MAARGQGRDELGLSLRWAIILACSTGCGFLIGHFEGIGVGFMSALALAGFLYAALGRR